MIALQLSSVLAYAGIALLVGAESAGMPVPGETSLIGSAVLASQMHLSLPLVITAAAGGAIVGDNIGYTIGRRGGRWLLTRPGRWERSRALLLVRGEAFFARHGPSAVFFGRWVPWLRITAAWLAGANRMPWRRFFFWNALGGVAWATTIGVTAYSLGKAAAAVIGTVGLAVVALLVVALAGVVLARRLHASRAPAERDTSLRPRPGPRGG